MNWYKKADFLGRDPYKVDFAHEQEKAEQMDTNTLLHALSDAIEAIEAPSINEGKYYDQASVYRKVLQEREISFEEQDKLLKDIPSLHTKSPDIKSDRALFETKRFSPTVSTDPYRTEDTNPCKDPNDRPRSNGKNKSYQGYPNIEKPDYYALPT